MSQETSLTLTLENRDEALLLFGSRDQNLRMIRDALQVRIVARGDVLAVLEAMKMEQQIIAPIGGKVTTVAVAANQQVAARDILFIVEGEPA